MPHDAGDGIFIISEHWTAIRTGWVLAVMACRGDGLLIWLLLPQTGDEPDITPRFIIIKAVQRMTRRHAGFAARASIQIDLKGILLTSLRLRKRDQVGEAVSDTASVILLREQGDGCAEGLLFFEHLPQQV
ncbi:MAG: hypothetical protein LDL31_06390 [Prosthecobacter sp.]|nr:hypothetical protein [Prosthecobacter sp.]